MRTILTALCIIAAAAAHGDTKITLLADVTADRAEVVIGPQSNRLDEAHAHTMRRDNPHGITPGQIGALTQVQLAEALAALEFTALASQDSAWFFTIDGGTGRVWSVYPTNLVYYSVSDQFGYMRPDGTVVEFSGAARAPLSTFNSQDANFICYQDDPFFAISYVPLSIPTHMNPSLPPDYPWTVPHAYYNSNGSQSGSGSLTIGPRDVMITNLVAVYDLSMIVTVPDLTSAIADITVPMILRDGVWYRQYWDTNLLTTAWEPVQ